MIVEIQMVYRLDAMGLHIFLLEIEDLQDEGNIFDMGRIRTLKALSLEYFLNSGNTLITPALF